jgi:RNA polymerase sigma-70 factor (ECF subfamily)
MMTACATLFAPALRVGKNAAKAAGWSVILPGAMADDDADVIRSVLDGDVDRYAALVEKYQAQALRIAFSLLGNAEDARDASQDAFVNAYRSLPTFRGRARFSTWLYRIVVNACTDLHRRRARQPSAAGLPGDGGEDALFEAVDHGVSPQEALSQRETSRRLGAAIKQLPPQQRTAFVLHYVHGLPLADVAEVMACRVGTVKSHVFRAAGSLRAQLNGWMTQEASHG